VDLEERKKGEKVEGDEDEKERTNLICWNFW
jgi:hypothetical protein